MLCDPLFLYLYSTSSSLEQLSQHSQSTHDKVLVLVNQAKDVTKGCTARHISVRILSKLPEVQELSNKFNLMAKEQLLQCTGGYLL